MRIEFEYNSKNFLEHGHNPDECDIIVCWEHNWKDCPLEVIELREIIKDLPNKPITRPDKTTKEEEYTLEKHLDKLPEGVKILLSKFNEKIKSFSDEIWSKITSSGLTYYSPERVFVYLDKLPVYVSECV